MGVDDTVTERPDAAGRPSGKGSVLTGIRTIRDNLGLIGLTRRSLAVLAGLAFLSGIAQAGILIVLVSVATELAAGNNAESPSLFGLGGHSAERSIAIGFALTAVFLVTEIGLTWLKASLLERCNLASRTALIRAFSRADYPTQIGRSRGDTQQVLLGLSADAVNLIFIFNNGMAGAVSFSALVITAVVLSPGGAGLVFAGLALVALPLRPLLRRSSRLGGRNVSLQRRLGTLAAERIDMVLEVRSFGVDGPADETLLSANRELATNAKRARLASGTNGVVFRAGAFVLVLIMLAVISRYDVTSFTALAGSLLILVRSLNYAQVVQNALQETNERAPSLDQLAEEVSRLRAGAEIVDPSAEVLLPGSAVETLELRDVSFSYDGARDAIAGIDLTIQRGEFVAIVGPSGSGKSTLVRLLLRLFPPSSGAIFADGVDIADVPHVDWRRRLSFVPQESRLQAGPAREAIRFFREGIPDEQVEHAARRAHVLTSLLERPGGLASEVGFGGGELSGGQRQRVALARALVGEPDILLMDEPTSALDPRSEGLIKQTLLELRGDATVIVISHRMSTIENADRLFLMQDGTLRELEDAVEAARYVDVSD